jgi:hypothetical protein
MKLLKKLIVPVGAVALTCSAGSAFAADVDVLRSDKGKTYKTTLEAKIQGKLFVKYDVPSLTFEEGEVEGTLAASATFCMASNDTNAKVSFGAAGSTDNGLKLVSAVTPANKTAFSVNVLLKGQTAAKLTFDGVGGQADLSLESGSIAATGSCATSDNYTLSLLIEESAANDMVVGAHEGEVNITIVPSPA